MRLKRWYGRLNQKDQNKLSFEDIDDYLAYFSCAYHLKDWLEDYKSELKPNIKIFLKGSKELKICRDIVTVTKHCEFKSNAMADRDFSMHNEWNWLSKKTDLIFTFGNQRLSLFEIAKACYLQWLNFLLKEGLIIKEGEGFYLNEKFPPIKE